MWCEWATDMDSILILAFVSTALLLSLGVLAGFLTALVFAKRAVQRRSQIRNDLLAQHTVAYPQARWFPVQSCHQAHFSSGWKRRIWQDVGILLVVDRQAHFYSESRPQIPLRIDLSNRAGLKWVGRAFWPNGLYHWFSAEVADGVQYFTSETGLWVFSSRARTEAVYTELLNIQPTRVTTGP